jgi:hypothetical protein
LHGLDEQAQAELLVRLRDDEAYEQQLTSEPLLLKRPSIEPLVQLVKKAAKHPGVHQAGFT